jgi:hypothetical protein
MGSGQQDGWGLTFEEEDAAEIGFFPEDAPAEATLSAAGPSSEPEAPTSDTPGTGGTQPWTAASISARLIVLSFSPYSTTEGLVEGKGQAWSAL